MAKFAALLAALLLAALAPARAAETVELRAGEHPGFARIALQWPSPVAYDAKLDGATLTIHFARPFKAPLEIIPRRLHAYVARATQSADGTALIATLTRPAELKTMVVSRKTIVIDLVATHAAKPEKPALKPAPPAIRDSAAKPPVRLAAAARVVQPAFSPPARAEPAAAKPAPPSWAQPQPLFPAEAEPAAKPAAPASTDAATSAPAAAARPAGPLTPQLILANGRTSLRFDWPAPVAAAVFRRGVALWVVFGARTKLDLDPLRRAGQAQGILSAIDEVPAGAGTALRLVAADGLNPGVRRDGNAWIVDLKQGGAAPDAPVIVEPRPGAALPAVELHVGGASAPLRIKDPVFDDELIVVPVGELGRGVDVTRSFVDFRLLPSVQGLAIRPTVGDLVVHDGQDAVEVTRPNGLVLSNEDDSVLGGGTAGGLHRLFDFATWHGPKDEDFFTRRAELEQIIIAVAPAARTRPRLDLARFYFAYAFGAETLGVLDQIARDDPQAMSDRSIEALKGAACVLAQNKGCAEQELGLATFDDEPEAALWRGALAVENADWPSAAREFLRGVGLLPTYPKRLRNRFAIEAAQALLKTDRAAAAGPLIDLVLKDEPDYRDRAMARYLDGERQLQFGHLADALKTWADVAANGDRKARARALYARAMALYAAKKASRLDTINALDALRFSWRGDDFEFTLLRRLGELDLEAGDPDDGIEALHEAAVYFPNYPDAKAVAQEAGDAFANLFIGKDAGDMPPVKALALYNEFHDLEPAGARHDAITKNLIDRLVAVDLLDQASALLEDQVKNGLTGNDKARGATQLALLRLMNRQPKAALAALAIDVGDRLPADLARQRLELRARALTDLNQSPQALALLAPDDSVDAARLRADIYWRQHDWKDAVKVFARLAGSPPEKGPLAPATARVVLAWAAALEVEGDQPALEKLRQDFGAAIAGTPSAQAFDIIAEDGRAALAGGGNAADIAARVAEIGTLQSFMSAYRERLAASSLSAIN